MFPSGGIKYNNSYSGYLHLFNNYFLKTYYMQESTVLGWVIAVNESPQKLEYFTFQSLNGNEQKK